MTIKNTSLLLTCLCVVAACGGGDSVATKTPATPPVSDEVIAPGSALIKLNQLGFMPGESKIAVVPDDAETPFHLLNASGEVVYSGQLSAEKLWSPSGEVVSQADFSDFNQPGEYRLQLNDGSESTAFEIGEDVFAEVHDAAAKAYYFNRASIALEPQYAGSWARAAGHPDDNVLVHSSAASQQRPAGSFIVSPKGWYDAGDYNKYIVNSGISTFTLLRALSDFPAFYQQRTWQLPESDNKLPDLLDEIRWNLDWMRTMQDPNDGGVYHKLTTLNFAGAVMPDKATEPRYVVQKTTAAALNYAAVMAQASRVLAAYETQLPGLAEDYRQSAIAAWQWAVAHPDIAYEQPADVKTGAYGDNYFDDEFAWASAELYLATGEDEYLNHFSSFDPDFGESSWANTASLGFITLWQDGQQTLQEQALVRVKQKLLQAADKMLSVAQNSAYGVAMEEKDFVWGSSAVALNKAMVLWQAWDMTENPDYKNAALGLVDYVLGRNPMDYSYVTGYGHKTPMHIHHRQSEADDVAEPVPGFLAGGAQNGWQDGCEYPSDKPASSYVDDWCSYSTNEVTINWNAPLVYMLAAFASN